MSRFLDPPAPKEPIAAEKVDSTYKSMRIKVFLGAFLGYAGYYLVRKNLSLAAPAMVSAGYLDNAGVGLAASAVAIAYAFSKFIMGTVSDRSDARKFLCIGLIIASITMIIPGVLPYSVGDRRDAATVEMVDGESASADQIGLIAGTKVVNKEEVQVLSFATVPSDTVVVRPEVLAMQGLDSYEVSFGKSGVSYKRDADSLSSIQLLIPGEIKKKESVTVKAYSGDELLAQSVISVKELEYARTSGMYVNIVIMFILMLVVGWVSGMGWPPCGRIMAHWFSQNERSFKMSVWNTSHTIGSGSLSLLGMAGVALFAVLGFVTWRAYFIVPSIVAILIAVICWFLLRDTPESCGLPSIQDWRNDYSGVKSKGKAGEKLPFKTLLVDYVFKNKLLWAIALSNVAVYMIRYGVGSWAPSYLQQAGIMDERESNIVYSVHNYIGAVGTILCGLAASKIFKGRCAPMNVICMIAVLVGVVLYWLAGANSEHMSPLMTKILIWAGLLIIGFFIYGPVALIGIQALNTVPKNAAGTAAGFVGLFGYLLGDALFAETMVGKLSSNGLTWNVANFSFVIASVIGVVLCALMIPSEKKAA